MSAANFVTTVPVFEGVQGRFYLVDGEKYSVYFPIAWAHDHITFYNEEEQQLGTGPKNCGNCKKYGSIRGVFVGYCSNCLENYHDSGYWRGSLTAPTCSTITMLEERDMWSQYPYLSGVKKYSIGDEEGADLTEQCVNSGEFDNDEADEMDIDDEADDEADDDADDEADAMDIDDDSDVIAALVAAAEAAAEAEDGIIHEEANEEANDDDVDTIIINPAEDEEANEDEDVDTFVINETEDVYETEDEQVNGVVGCNIG